MSALYFWFITFIILFSKGSSNEHLNTNVCCRELWMKTNTHYHEATITIFNLIKFTRCKNKRSIYSCFYNVETTSL